MEAPARPERYGTGVIDVTEFNYEAVRGKIHMDTRVSWDPRVLYTKQNLTPPSLNS